MLPWGPDGKWLQEGVIGKVLGDWQVTGVFSAISGTPIDFTASATGLRAPGNSNTPNVTGSPECWAASAPVRSGLTRRSFLLRSANQVGQRGAARSPEWPGVLQPRRIARKIVRFGTRRAEIRADFFNALNIPHYANPNGTLGNANFGRITSILAQTERVIRFGARFLF